MSVWVEMLTATKKNRGSSVTLHVSVWVEMRRQTLITMFASCHAPRERVSWNSRVFNNEFISLCHAPRERVSWNLIISASRKTAIRHAPRERVSWNSAYRCRSIGLFVTLHVSVWVEINISFLIIDTMAGHAPRERVSWNLPVLVVIRTAKRHAPRERVSWNIFFGSSWND